MAEEKHFYRLKEIVSCPKEGREGLLPISRTTFLVGVKKGHYPKPVRLSAQRQAWRAIDLKPLVDGEWPGAA